MPDAPARWTPQMPFRNDPSRHVIVDATGRTICTYALLIHDPPTARNPFAIELARVWAEVAGTLKS